MRRRLFLQLEARPDPVGRAGALLDALDAQSCAPLAEAGVHRAEMRRMFALLSSGKGLRSSAMLIPDTSRGTSTRRTKSGFRPRPRRCPSIAHSRRLVKVQLSCKDAPSAADAGDTSVFGMPHEEEDRKLGMSAIAATPLVASRTANRLQDHPSTGRLESS